MRYLLAVDLRFVCSLDDYFEWAFQLEEMESNGEDEEIESEMENNMTNAQEEALVDSIYPSTDQKERIITEFERKKANCKTDDLEKLQSKCQILVRDCIAGLLVELSNEDFKAMEGKALMVFDLGVSGIGMK